METLEVKYKAALKDLKLLKKHGADIDIRDGAKFARKRLKTAMKQLLSALKYADYWHEEEDKASQAAAAAAFDYEAKEFV